MARAISLLVGAMILIGLLAGPGSSSSTSGLELVLRATHAPTAKQLTRSIAIETNRARLLKASGVQISKRGTNEIVIRLGSVPDPVQATRVLASPGKLEFYDLEADLTGRSIAHGFAVAARKIPRTPKDTTVIRCGGGAFFCPGVKQSPVKPTFYYLVKHDPAKGIPELTGSDLIRSATRADFDPTTNQPIVLMKFTNAGAVKFDNITAKEAERGKRAWTRAGRPANSQRYWQHFAIVLDGQIESSPGIDFQQNPNGIYSNSAQITGLRIAEAKGLALLMTSGTLPVRFVIVSRRV